MSNASRRRLRIALAIAAVAGGLFVSEDFTLIGALTGTHSLVTQAQARIGRPLTPLSYAGVAPA
jgi:hypothetical protein